MEMNMIDVSDMLSILSARGVEKRPSNLLRVNKHEVIS